MCNVRFCKTASMQALGQTVVYQCKPLFCESVESHIEFILIEMSMLKDMLWIFLVHSIVER